MNTTALSDTDRPSKIFFYKNNLIIILIYGTHTQAAILAKLTALLWFKKEVLVIDKAKISRCKFASISASPRSCYPKSIFQCN